MKNQQLIKVLQKFPPDMDVVQLDLRREETQAGGIYPVISISQLGPATKSSKSLLAIEITEPRLPEDQVPTLGQALEVAMGLQIINRNRPTTESSYHVRAEHDVIYAGSLEWELSDQDKQDLERLGWTEDDDVDGWRHYV